MTADDFGAAGAVNEAVEQAHVQGILTAASLMVTGDAVADAVARARRLPRLGVGLHLVLVEGRPVLPPERVRGLVGPDGLFRTDMARLGLDIFLRPSVRRQMRAEVAAQFAAFAETGLPLDHVNAHKHFHLHPTIAAAVVEIGAHHGMRAVRTPVELRDILRRIEPGTPRGNAVERLWAMRLQRRLRHGGLSTPDQVFGLAWSGALDAERLRGLLSQLPAGLTEIYCHPATDDDYSGHAPGYRYRDELAGLTAPAVRREVGVGDLILGNFTDFI